MKGFEFGTVTTSDHWIMAFIIPKICGNKFSDTTTILKFNQVSYDHRSYKHNFKQLKLLKIVFITAMIIAHLISTPQFNI